MNARSALRARLALAALAVGASQVPARAMDEPPTAPPPPQTSESDSWRYKLAGYVRLDAIHDFDPIGSTDFFDPRTIPVDGGVGTNTRLHARESRLSLEIAGPGEGRSLRFFVESDFYGSDMRLRHAYGEYRGWLAGLTFSTFIDEANIPPTIDFEAPAAAPIVRSAMLRYSRPLSDRTSFAVAVEESNPEVLPPPGVEGETEKPAPDLTTRLRVKGERGHLHIGGFLGKSRFRAETGEAMDQTLWGVLLSGRYRPFGRDAAYAQVLYGPGVGRYDGGVTAAPNPFGELEAAKAFTYVVGYQRYWTARWSSNVVHSAVHLLSDVGGPEANERLRYAAVNLVWWFLPERAWAGVEFLKGERRLRSGAHGSADRIQLAVRFNFPPLAR